MKRIIFPILMLVFSIFAGCTTQTPSPVIDMTPLSTQIGHLSQANADLREANVRLQNANDALKVENERLRAMLRADADAGLTANKKGWLSFEGYVWNHQITLLPGPPDDVTQEKWSEAAKLYETGGEAAMQGVINSRNADAAKTNRTIGDLKRTITILESERDDAQEAVGSAQRRLQEAEQAFSAAIAKARQDAADEIRRDQIKKITQGAMGCGALAVLASVAALFSPVGKKKFWLLSILMLGWGISLMMLARWLGNVWFERGIAIFWSAVAIGFGVWIIRSAIAAEKVRKESEENKKNIERYATWGKHIVPSIDDIYEDKTSLQSWIDAWKKEKGTEPTQSDFIETRLLDKLSDNEDASTKTVVDEIRAATKSDAK